MAELRWSPKDPDEDKDYSFNWTEVLNGDAISSSEWTVIGETDLIIDYRPSTFTETKATFWARAGSLGKTYEIRNLITTVAGRKFNRTRKLSMKSL